MAAEGKSDDKKRLAGVRIKALELIGPSRNASFRKLSSPVLKMTPAQYKRWWENAVAKAAVDSCHGVRDAMLDTPLPEAFQEDYEKRVTHLLRGRQTALERREGGNLELAAKRMFGLENNLVESLLRLPELQEVLWDACFDVGSIGLRCVHCCAEFETALQTTAHSDYCTQNANKVCSFCAERCMSLDAKRNHEATCTCNPALWCEWCNVKFSHQALRDKHKQHCVNDPCKTCAFCSTTQSTRTAAILHQEFCAENPNSKAEWGECISCADDACCIRFPCGEHLYCGRCTLRLTNFALKDRSKLPLRCCKQCVQPGDAVDLTIARILSEESRQKYQEAMLEKVSKIVMYCPVISCGALIALDEVARSDSEMAGPHGCPKCQQALCFQCRSEWHAGVTCSRYQYLASKTADETTQYCRQMGWMQCFECGHVVEKRGGCNHISCFCGAQFCYTCGSKWGGCTCQVIGAQHALRHNRTLSNQTQYHCTFCRQPYPSREEMRAHMRTCRSRLDQLGGAYECTFCLDRFQNGEELRAHTRNCKASKNRSFDCFRCSREHRQVTRFVRLASALLQTIGQDPDLSDCSATVQFRFDSQEVLRRHRRLCGDLALCGPC